MFGSCAEWMTVWTSSRRQRWDAGDFVRQPRMATRSNLEAVVMIPFRPVRESGLVEFS